MSDRLPAHLEVSALIRAVDQAGGFATVIAKGERDAGTILLVCSDRGGPARALERMPRPDGTSGWEIARQQDMDDPAAFWDYLKRRQAQDRDLWIVELDIADPERFIA
ncbi:MAG: DUF1491 family protein [Porphyrobacter sp.]|nr:DUF1491 family protein [Porphyrobacter sp.]